jgi:hypothetical protein
MTTRKKLIEVALPLEAIVVESVRGKSIRHGHLTAGEIKVVEGQSSLNA